MWAVFAGFAVATAGAQTSVPPGRVDQLKDTSVLVLPKATKVAIVEFDDLECPGCARALPLVEAASTRYNVPVLHHDYPLTEVHVWSFDAAITARYLRDRVSPKASDEFRRDTFAHQTLISNKDDLAGYTTKWFADHKLKPPFALGANSVYGREVQADRDLAKKMALRGTPSIFVVTPQGWIEVLDWTKLDATVGAAAAQYGKH